MQFSKAHFFLLLVGTLCGAGAITIQGTVTDNKGAAVASAQVCLEQSGLVCSTGVDGSFLLTDRPVPVRKRGVPHNAAFMSASIRNGLLRIDLPAAATGLLAAYDLHGRLLFSINMPLVAGINCTALPAAQTGVHLFRIQAGSHRLVLRSQGIGSVYAHTRSDVVHADRLFDSRSAGFNDVVKVTGSGYLTNRLPVYQADQDDVQITLLPCAGIVTDADGNEYETVRLGNQVWMAEHLRTTRYNDGTPIPQIQQNSQWANRSTPAFCYYNGTTDPDTIKRFGAIYNFHTVQTGNLAPLGWRIPGEADWMALQNWLIANGYNHDGSNGGNKIGKSMAATTDWDASNSAGAVGNDLTKNNRSGFNAYSNGYRGPAGDFGFKGARCIMQCTATKHDQWGSFGYFTDLNTASAELRYSDDWMSMGFSARCIKE